MLDNEQYTSEELEFYIKKFINNKDTDTLIFLCAILRKVKILMPIEKTMDYLDKNDIKHIQTITTNDDKVWVACYSNNNEMNNKYRLVEIDFYELVKKSRNNELIEGIIINPNSDFALYLNKKILNNLDNI